MPVHVRAMMALQSLQEMNDRARRAKTFTNENEKTNYATSCKNPCSQDAVLAEQGVKQTQELAKMTKTMNIKDHKSSISLFICRPYGCFKVLI